MIGIESIARYLPEERISNLDRKEQFGISEEFIRNKLGVPSVLRKRDDEETSDLCVRAYEALAAKASTNADQVDFLVVCTQNPDEHGLPHTSAIVHEKLGCGDEVAAFDISLGCSGYVYGLSTAVAFMQHNGLTHGLLFTADPYSKILDPDDKNTTLLFSDAATVTLLGPDPVFTLGEARFATRGSEHRKLRNLDGCLEMNGRAIFNFSATRVPDQIRGVVRAAGLQMEDVDLFVFHQASKYLLDTMSRRLELPAGRVATNLDQVGNTVSSSVPLLLEEALGRGEVRRILISGFGVGLSWATALLERAGSAP